MTEQEKKSIFNYLNGASDGLNQGFKDGYNQALDDLQKMIDDEYLDGDYGDYHEVEMIVRMIKRLKQ